MVEPANPEFSIGKQCWLLSVDRHARLPPIEGWRAKVTPLTIVLRNFPKSMGEQLGVLVVETIAKIRRAHFVDGKSIK